MVVHPFELAPIAEQIWREKYQFRCDGRERLGCADAVAADRTGTEARAHPESDASMADTWRRVAVAAASVETTETARRNWAEQFDAAMRSFVFIPGGRIIAGAGTGRRVTLFNCFVMGDMPDDLGSIFDSLKDAALTMQQGGGIGQDFSTLRPKGAPLSATGATASGPLSFMDVWNTMCGTIMSAGARRGAMMATLRCDHPDLLDFIEAKTTRGRLTNFNLSVLVTDAFVEAVRADRDWPLVFNGETYAVHKARSIWDRIMRATYDSAEPGVIFIDRVNALNNLAHCETIAATNPCGEQPLPAFGACLLGSINLTQLVNDPFSDGAHLDLDRLDEHVRTAVRLLDNIIDVSGYPLAAQRAEALAKRRIGLGVTGLANALAMCGIAYGTPLAAERMGTWLARLKAAAYDASADIAAEKGPFPLFDADAMLAAPNLLTLPDTVRAKIATHGLRNGCLTTIAPTGTTSLIAGNVSSGIEPTFAPRYRRSVLGEDGETRDMMIERVDAHRRCNPALAHGTAPALLQHGFRLSDELQPVGDAAPVQALETDRTPPGLLNEHRHS